MLQTISNLCMIVAVVWGFVSYMKGPDLHTPPGVLVPEEPVQQTCPTRLLAEVAGYKMTAVATYTIRGRVLHKKLYYEKGNEVAPYDIALGWGRMSDQSVLDKMTISQGNRFYFYEYEGGAPIPEKEIIAHSSNNHLIAANRSVAWTIRGLYPGEVVTLTGYLVNVVGPNGFQWNTSLSRTDSGANSCEVMYVETIKEEGEVAPIPATPTPAPAPKPAEDAKPKA